MCFSSRNSNDGEHIFVWKKVYRQNPLRRSRASSPEGGALCDIPDNSTFCVEGAGYGHVEKSSPFGGADIA